MCQELHKAMGIEMRKRGRKEGIKKDRKKDVPYSLIQKADI